MNNFDKSSGASVELEYHSHRVIKSDFAVWSPKRWVSSRWDSSSSPELIKGRKTPYDSKPSDTEFFVLSSKRTTTHFYLPPKVRSETFCYAPTEAQSKEISSIFRRSNKGFPWTFTVLFLMLSIGLSYINHHFFKFKSFKIFLIFFIIFIIIEINLFSNLHHYFFFIIFIVIYISLFSNLNHLKYFVVFFIIFIVHSFNS